MLEKIRKSALVILLVLVSCSFWLLASAAEPPALAKLSGAEKARVAKLIEGAKKEGKLVGYSVYVTSGCPGGICFPNSGNGMGFLQLT